MSRGAAAIRHRGRGGKIDAPHSIRRTAGGRRLQISDQVIKDVERCPVSDNDAVRCRASASRRQIADLVLEDVLSRPIVKVYAANDCARSGAGEPRDAVAKEVLILVIRENPADAVAVSNIRYRIPTHVITGKRVVAESHPKDCRHSGAATRNIAEGIIGNSLS